MSKRDQELVLAEWREAISRRPVVVVQVPSGSPPVALTGKVTDGAILRWARETRDWYRRRGEFVTCYGLSYLLRMYFIDEGEHPRAVERAERVIGTLGDEVS